MRLGSFGAQFRTPDLNDDDRLTSCGRQFCHFDKFAGVFESLDKPGYYLCVVIIEQIAHEIREIQVSLVSRGYDVAESYSAVYRPVQKRTKGGSATLADQPNRSTETLSSSGRCADPDIVFHISQAEAVGAADPEA